MKSPEQALFDTVFSTAQKAGYAVYDYLPQENESVSYPFVVVGNINSVGKSNKTAISEKIHIHIDVWGSRNERQVVSTMTDTLFKMLANRVQSKWGYVFNPVRMLNTKQYLQDTSIPNQTFNRGMLDLYFMI